MALVPPFSAATKAASHTTVLIVEDDPFQANPHREALEKCVRVERAADASEAFIRIEDPGFRDTLALVVAGLRMPGVAGPAFVSELMARLPLVPILVIGRVGETARDYPSQNVSFLPATASEDELLASVRKILARRLQRVA